MFPYSVGTIFSSCVQCQQAKMDLGVSRVVLKWFKVLCKRNLPKLVSSINQFVYLINEFYHIN